MAEPLQFSHSSSTSRHDYLHPCAPATTANTTKPKAEPVILVVMSKRMEIFTRNGMVSMGKKFKQRPNEKWRWAKIMIVIKLVVIRMDCTRIMSARGLLFSILLGQSTSGLRLSVPVLRGDIFIIAEPYTEKSGEICSSATTFGWYRW